MGFKTTALMTTVSVLVASAPAFATTFTFETTNPAGSDLAGDITSILTSFNDNTNKFTWSSTIARNTSTGKLADGAWLVANDGPNPKGISGELAIYYLDAVKNMVSVYDYDGANNSASWKQPGTLLDSFALNVLDNGNDERTFSFDYNTTSLNAMNIGPNWQGTSFNDKVGIWFHAVSNLDAQYDAHTNKLTKFSHAPGQSWYDTSYQQAEAVPEPATAAALGLFAMAGAFVKRNKQSA